jgi:hypothetical protein
LCRKHTSTVKVYFDNTAKLRPQASAFASRIQHTTSGATGIGLYTTIKYMRSAAAIGLGTTINYL